METRRELLSEIYEDMTGELPPDDFWKTPTGCRIAENNPAFLYNHPTSNLYHIITELPAETYWKMIALLESKNQKTVARLRALMIPDPNAWLFKYAIQKSAMNVARKNSRNFPLRLERYRKPRNPALKESYRKQLYARAAKKKEDILFLFSVRGGDMYKRGQRTWLSGRK